MDVSAIEAKWNGMDPGVREAINFRRTYFYFIDFFTAFLKHQSQGGGTNVANNQAASDLCDISD